MPRKQIAHTSDDPTIDYTELRVNDKTYFLAFSFNSICMAERATGLNLLHAIQVQSLNALEFRAVFFAALSVAHPSITLEKTGDMITFDTLPMITTAISKAWTSSMSEPKKDEPTQAEE